MPKEFEVMFPLSLFDAPPEEGKLIVDPINYDLARKTVLAYHYSHAMPAGDLVCYGVWERATEYVGCVVYGKGANQHIGSPYGLAQHQVFELCRVAMRDHEVPVSRVIALTIKDLRRYYPEIQLLISYADEHQGHLGKIYQAGNWIYTGVSIAYSFEDQDGNRVHPRSVVSKYGSSEEAYLEEAAPHLKRINVEPKHKYLYPMTHKMRVKISSLSIPYPKEITSA